MRSGCVPSMRAKNTLDVGFGRESGVRSGLLNSDTIIVIQESKVLEGGFIFLRKLEGRADDGEDVFRDVLIVARKSEIVDLTEKQDQVTLIRRAIDGFVMTRGREVER